MINIFETEKSTMNIKIYRSIVFKILEGLKSVHLEIKEHNQIYSFGQDNASLKAQIEIYEPKAYSSLLFGGSIGMGESYIRKEWHSDDLPKVIQVFARNLDLLEKFEKRFAWLTYPVHLLQHWSNRNTKKNSRSNILAHYDISNEMYESMLDPNMQYSSAVFDNKDQSLDDAQLNKLKKICDDLKLTENDHLLEIGTGWGGLALYAAENYGCKVTTTTISDAQYEYAKERISRSNSAPNIELLKKDYRELTGQYDKVVSIEMIEAVGHQFLPGYFKKIDTLLKDKGLLLIQAITIKDQQYDQYRKGVDFIQRYIFPGGCLPSISEMTKVLKHQTNMSLVSLNDFGIDYANTIEHWQMRFNRYFQSMKDTKLDESFSRLWTFYFSYCIGGFREGNTSVIHFKAVK